MTAARTLDPAAALLARHMPALGSALAALPGARALVLEVGADGAAVVYFDDDPDQLEAGHAVVRVVWPDGAEDVRTVPLAELAAGAARRRLGVVPDRPMRRGDCLGGLRPCPWVSCRHHMVYAMGRRVWRMSDEELVDQIAKMDESCTLDVADCGGETLDAVGRLLGLSRERVRQIEMVGLERARRAAETRRLDGDGWAHAVGRDGDDCEVMR